MLVSCRMRPLRCARIVGSTARVISAAAKKLTSICSRSCIGRELLGRAERAAPGDVGEHVDAAEAVERGFERSQASVRVR